MRVFLLLSFVVAQAACGQDIKPQPRGLDRIATVLKQMIRFEIDEYGRLQLRKDHWTVAAKRFSIEPLRKARLEKYLANYPHVKKADIETWTKAWFGGASGRNGLQRIRRALGFWKMFHYLSVANVATPARWSKSPTGWSSNFHSGDAVSMLIGNCKIHEGCVILRLEEYKQPGRVLKRKIWVSADGTSISVFLLGGDGSFFQILQAAKSVHVSGTTADGIVSATGSSFVAVAKRSPEVFAALSEVYSKFHLGKLPLDKAVALTPKAYANPKIQPVKLPEGSLTSDQTVKFVGRVGPVTLAENRIVLNHPPHAGPLEEAAHIVAVDEWREAIQKEARQQSVERPNLKDGGFFSRFGTRDLYVRFSDWRGLSLNMEMQQAVVDYAITETWVNLWLSDERTYSYGNGLAIAQHPSSGLVMMTLRGEEEVLSISGANYLDLLARHEQQLRTRFVPVLEKYGFVGWNPLDATTVAAVLTELKTDPANAVAARTEDRVDRAVHALIDNRQYLKLLVDRVDSADQKLVTKRIEELDRTK